MSFAKYVIVSCELTDLIPEYQHFVNTVVMEENTQVYDKLYTINKL